MTLVGSRRGFTLLELMASLAVLGIMTALAVGGLGPAVRRARLGTAAEQVQQAVALARAEARAGRRCTRVDLIADPAASPASEAAITSGGRALRIWRWKDARCQGTASTTTARMVQVVPLPDGVAARLSAGTGLTWMANGRTQSPPQFTVDWAGQPNDPSAKTVVVADNGPSCAFLATAVGGCP